MRQSESESVPINEFVRNNFKQRICTRFVYNERFTQIWADKHRLQFNYVSPLCSCGKPEEWHSKNANRRLSSTSKSAWAANVDTELYNCNSFGKIKLKGFSLSVEKHIPKFIRFSPGNLSDKTTFLALEKLFSQYWKIRRPNILISLNGGASDMNLPSYQLWKSFRDILISVSSCVDTWITTGGFKCGVFELAGKVSRDFTQVTKSKTRRSLHLFGIMTWGNVLNQDQLENEINLQSTEMRCAHPLYSMDDPLGGDNDTGSDTEDEAAQNITVENDQIGATAQLESEPSEHALLPKRVNIASWHPHATWQQEVSQQNMTGKMKTFEYVYQSEPEPHSQLLDPYHDYFLMVDNGTYKKYGGEIDFRVAFEDFFHEHYNIPVVQFLMDGGPNSLVNTRIALEKNIPVVVIAGSERAADLIAAILDIPEEKLLTSPVLGEVSIAKIMRLNVTDSNKISSIRESAIAIHAKRELIVSFDMQNMKNEMENAIIDAVFTAGQNLSASEKFRMAMTFNRKHIAEQIYVHEIGLDDLCEFLLNCFMRNQTDFISLLLNENVPIREIFTETNLFGLYFKIHHSIHDKDSQGLSFFRNMLKTHQIYHQEDEDADEYDKWKNQKIALSDIGEMLKHLTNNVIRKNFYAFHDVNRNQQFLNRTEEIDDAGRQNELGYTAYPVYKSNGERVITEHDLLIWALMLSRIDMAMILLKCGRDQIGSALMCSGICKRMAEKAEYFSEFEIATQHLFMSEKFEHFACQILTEAYARDKDRTYMLLIRQLPYWGNMTCLSIADEMECMDFIYHPACQTRLNQIWCGHMSPFISLWRILLNIPFGLILSKALIFNNTDHYDDIAKEETKKTEMAIKHDLDKPCKKSEHQDLSHKKFALNSRTNNSVSITKSIYYYYTAPIVKFIFNMMSYIVFLGLYCYMMLVQFVPFKITLLNPSYLRVEFSVYIFVLGMFLQEIHQIVSYEDSNSSFTRIREHFKSAWNHMDLLNFALIISSIVTRFTMHTIDIEHENFTIVRTMYALVFAFLILRYLQFYIGNKTIGPKIYMLYRMTKDIFFFLAIYSVVIFSYGTFSHALRHPNSKLSSNIIKNILYVPYWQTYGELDLEVVEGNPNCVDNFNISSYSNETAASIVAAECAHKNVFVMIACAIYLLFTNILLINLLVAMFGYTFQKVQDISSKVWTYKRFQLIQEFYLKSILPPPLNILEIILELFLATVNNRCTARYGDKFKQWHLRSRGQLSTRLGHIQNKYYSGFEKICMESITEKDIK